MRVFSFKLDDAGSVPTAINIGTPITGGTEGSVLFIGSGDVLAQDNANFFWNDADNRLGLGTATPTSLLHLKSADNVQATNILQAYSNNGAQGFGIGFNVLRQLGTNANIGVDSTGTGWVYLNSAATGGVQIGKSTNPSAALRIDNTTGTSNSALDIFGQSGQTGDLVRVGNSAGTNLFNISSTGETSVKVSSASTKGLIVRGAAAQTANLQDWQNSGSSILSSVNKDGYFAINSIQGTTSPTTAVLDVNSHTNSSDISNTAARFYSLNRSQHVGLAWQGLYGTSSIQISPAASGNVYIHSATSDTGGTTIGMPVLGANARLFVTGQPTISGGGTVDTTSGSTVVTGTGTNFVVNIGTNYTITIGANTYAIRSVDSSTQVTLYTAAVASVSGQAYTYTKPTIQTTSNTGNREFGVNSLGNVITKNAIAPNFVFDLTGSRIWSVGSDSSNNTRFVLKNITNNTVPFYIDGSAGADSLVINSSGNVGVGTSTISAKLHALATTEQLRLGYDASNYYSTTVQSDGSVVFNAVGTIPSFYFSDSVTIPIDSTVGGSDIAIDFSGYAFNARTLTALIVGQADNADTVTSLAGHAVSELTNDADYLVAYTDINVADVYCANVFGTDINGTNGVFDYLTDGSFVPIIDVQNRILKDSSSTTVLDWSTQAAALTTQLTSITHTAPGTPDYAIQNLTNVGGFGFVTADEGNTVLSVIANLQARLAQLESRLQTYGLLA